MYDAKCVPPSLPPSPCPLLVQVSERMGDLYEDYRGHHPWVASFQVVVVLYKVGGAPRAQWASSGSCSTRLLLLLLLLLHWWWWWWWCYFCFADDLHPAYVKPSPNPEP